MELRVVIQAGEIRGMVSPNGFWCGTFQNISPVTCKIQVDDQVAIATGSKSVYGDGRVGQLASAFRVVAIKVKDSWWVRPELSLTWHPLYNRKEFKNHRLYMKPHECGMNALVYKSIQNLLNRLEREGSLKGEGDESKMDRRSAAKE